MKRIASLSRFSALGFCVLMLALVACGGSTKPTNTPAPAPSSPPAALPSRFVGSLPGTNAFIALTTDNGASLSYVCDSDQTSAWFAGPLASPTALDLANPNGDHLSASLSPSGASGTVTLAGKPFPFTAAPASGDAGLFRAEQQVNGTKVVGGWIVNQAGEQRGALQGSPVNDNRDAVGTKVQVVAAPQLVVAQKASATTWSVQTAQFGTLTVQRAPEPDDHKG
jgi:hypothetical protein